MGGRKLTRLLLFVFVFVILCGIVFSFTRNKKTKQPDVPLNCSFSLSDAIPSSNEKLRSLDHTYYQIGYSQQHKQASYVAYLLTADMVSNNENAKRGGTKFKKDPLLRKHYSISDDYKNSGYVRGHLCPSKDMCWSYPSMKETFLMSNVSPQYEKFNNGLWKKLENQVREWALQNDSIIVITGPVLTTKKAEIGKNRVSVCGKFYKVIIDVSYPSLKMIGFIMDNTNLKGSVYKYSCTIKEVEQISGLDFFPSYAEDKIVDSLENNINVSLWKTQK